MKKYDLIFFLILIMFYIFFFLKPHGNNFAKKFVKIVTPYNTKIVSLNENQLIFAKGALGITKIQIKNLSVCVIESPCRNKICIQTGKIYNPDQIIYCATNGIYITIESEKSENYLDAISK